ncbi:MAG: radical SAM protein, partial [Pseudomonadota bacterium]
QPNFEQQLKRFQPDVVGISCLYTSHTGATWDLAGRAKRVLPNCKVVVGGQPPSLGPQFFFSPNIDVIVSGDGEDTMADLCRAWDQDRGIGSIAGLVINSSSGQTATSIRSRPKSLSQLARPDRSVAGVDRSRHFMSFSRPMGLMEVTRGCPFDCNFCSIWKMADGKVRSQTVESAVEELASMKETSIFFSDDHFFANAKLMRQLGQAIVDANLGKTFNVQSRADVFVKHPELIPVWKEAGLNAVFLGLEGHSDSRLDNVRKRTESSINEQGIKLLQDAGIGVVGNLMVDPMFTKSDFSSLRQYVEDKNLFFAAYCVATPFPGTELWADKQSEVTTWNFELFDIQHAVTKTALPIEEFYEEYAECWRHRARLQPTTTMLYKMKRMGSVLFKEGLNFELIKNVRRFDKDVVTPNAYLEDHHIRTSFDWEPGAMSAQGLS